MNCILTMGPTSCLLLLVLVFMGGCCETISSVNSSPCFERVFAFGDSLTDTGNAIHTSNPIYQVTARLPYGETFFHRPTGRCSDGRLVIDFLCEALDTPLLMPYLVERGSSFATSGENFAIAGTTALSTTFLQQNTGVTSFTSLSLANEIEWFRTSKAAARIRLGDAEVEDMVKSSLFYFGEIGGNDYNYWSQANKTVDDISRYIPLIMDEIHRSLQELVDEGASNIIVQGNLPMGCLPSYLKTRPRDPQDYDQLNCLKAYNALSDDHNAQLRSIMQSLKSSNPHVNLVYFDIQGAFLSILQDPGKYGFTNTNDPCFNLLGILNPNVPLNVTYLLNQHACSVPNEYISWDGIHLTEAMYKALARLLLNGGFSEPRQNFLTEECQLSFKDF